MSETMKAKLHRVIGGIVCVSRRRHRLMLATQVWHERTGVSHQIPVGDRLDTSLRVHEMRQLSSRRPFCLTCWRCPAD